MCFVCCIFCVHGFDWLSNLRWNKQIEILSADVCLIVLKIRRTVQLLDILLSSLSKFAQRIRISKWNKMACKSCSVGLKSDMEIYFPKLDENLSGRIVTKILSITPLQCKTFKIKYFYSASEIFEIQDHETFSIPTHWCNVLFWLILFDKSRAIREINFWNTCTSK